MPNTNKLVRRALIVFALFAAIGPSCGKAWANNTITGRLQQILDTYVADRGKIEGVSGTALHIDLGKHHRPFDLFAGTNGLPNNKPIDDRTLFQIGSNTKHFTAALILQLEAEGKLDINQTVGDWLPDYPAWKDVTIRSMLNMTSPIANYSETDEIGKQIAADIHHQFAPRELIAAVDPNQGRHLPVPTGWFYSNTNDVLASLIIEAATGLSYKQALETRLFIPFHLRDTYYSDGRSKRQVIAREPRGLYQNDDCLLYQPLPCTDPTLGPLIGHDMRAQNLSWADAAGGIISTPRDLATWIRALFAARVFPQRQLDEMMETVSQETGLPIPDVSPSDPRGFGLDLGRLYLADTGGSVWFYQGTTLGFRAIFAFWPQFDLVITAATNSQPPEGEDQFGATVIPGAFKILQEAGLLEPRDR